LGGAPRLALLVTIKASDRISERPPRKAVFLFVPIMQRCVGRYWHFAAFQTQVPNGRYRTKSGQRWILARDGSVAKGSLR
jgi:hypothetical protein